MIRHGSCLRRRARLGIGTCRVTGDQKPDQDRQGIATEAYLACDTGQPASSCRDTPENVDQRGRQRKSRQKYQKLNGMEDDVGILIGSDPGQVWSENVLPADVIYRRDIA